MLFSLKPTPAGKGGGARHVDVFEVTPSRAQIGPHAHVYVSVVFAPSALQGFSALLEAALEGVPAAQAKGRSLVFEVSPASSSRRTSLAAVLFT